MKVHETISPLYDFAFTQIFGTQKNLGNTKAFLKTLLDIPQDDYDRLTIESPILKRLSRKDKEAVVDLKLSTKSGRIIQIELQVEKEKSLKNRINYYNARMLTEQLNRGEDYDKLHQVISIVICDHELLEQEESYITEYGMCDHKNRIFTDLQKVVILELPKLPQEEDSAMWSWLQFFKCKEMEEFEMLAAKHPELENPVECVKYMSLRESWRTMMTRRFIQHLDENTRKKHLREKGIEEGLAQGLEQGLSQGLAKGREQSTLEIARKMKSMGLPVTQIAEGTGLSPDIIEKL